MGTVIASFLGDFSDYFAAVGVVAASYVALKICLSLMRAVGTWVISRGKNIGPHLRNMGSWAVVTGATDGIGKAYAQQLAQAGLNVVLISRTESKLKDVAGEIESRYKVKTLIHAADFSHGMSIYDGIRNKIQNLDVGVLVNNVGLSFDYPEYFLGIKDNREQVYMNLMYVNCTSVTMMTSIVMPGMETRKKGVVINLASAAGLRPTPLLSVYSACKAYVTFLSECLRIEYESKGIQVQCVNPYFVCSNMSKVRKPSLFIPTAETYVRSALTTLGQENITTGYWPHAFIDGFNNAMPESVINYLSFNTLGNARKRALKKLEAKKGQ